MPNGKNIEGAPWELYTPVASQATVGPYRSGFVGPSNAIQLIDLPFGDYRLVVRPPGYPPVELMLTATGASQEIALQVPDPATPTATATVPATTATSEPVASTTATVTPGITATSAAGTTPTVDPTATAGPTVSALPSTGAGGASMMPMVTLVTAACIVVLMLSAFVLRRPSD